MLCRKYSNQPVSTSLIFRIVSGKLPDLRRLILSEMELFNFKMLLSRGQRGSLSRW